MTRTSVFVCAVPAVCVVKKDTRALRIVGFGGGWRVWGGFRGLGVGGEVAIPGIQGALDPN